MKPPYRLMACLAATALALPAPAQTGATKSLGTAQGSGKLLTREQLLSEVWGTGYYGGTRTVDVHVRRLRAKLGEQEGLIGTVRGVGYGFARGQEESDER